MKNFSTYIIVGIAILSTVLLTGRLFDTTWAGGDGYSTQGTAVADEAVYQRGETIATLDGEWLEVQIGDTTVWMYENTELKLINLSEDGLELTVIQGRIVLYGHADMRIRDEVETLDGLYSYVNYSWLLKTDVQYINDDFNYSESEAADFYDWALF
ncbi:hypothetical protein HON52_04410 [Candidatus Uhrbacteria bacterium]|jgi:hypothetical protein|nr:hypothetical protein [Candidatus Uhrbacteria bacterium]